jgi:hypothetical protein
MNLGLIIHIRLEGNIRLYLHIRLGIPRYLLLDLLGRLLSSGIAEQLIGIS